MTVSRRGFLHTSAAAGALALAPSWLRLLAQPSTPARDGARPIADPAVRELALRAVEAARTAGAAYADVRLTDTRLMNGAQPREQRRDVGVRALVDGYWGFAASARWTPDEMARLGREAVHQAKVNGLGKSRVVELVPIPVVKDGHWEHPIERDPFEVPEGEIVDFGESLKIYFGRKSRAKDYLPHSLNFLHSFRRQDQAFASSEGSYYTQRLYRTWGSLSVFLNVGTASSPIISGASRGWEYIYKAPLREEIDRLVEEILADLALPVKPVEVGRYDVVCDAWSMAELLAETLGCGTDLARALGYLAHETGTSYLNDPLTMLGSYQAGAPLLSVTADRALPGGLATVQWDDEGVQPDRFPLVKDGVLTDFQTHREGAGWLKEVYGKQGRPVRSHGCATADRAFEAPRIAMPNLTLAPGPEALDFDGLVGGLKRGLAVKQLNVNMDWQCLNGFGTGRVYEVKDGKRVAKILGAEFLLRAPEVWNGLLALGAAASQQPFAKVGETSTVRAVPGILKQVTTIYAGGAA